jgi:hypothetical protein
MADRQRHDHPCSTYSFQKLADASGKGRPAWHNDSVRAGVEQGQRLIRLSRTPRSHARQDPIRRDPG